MRARAGFVVVLIAGVIVIGSAAARGADTEVTVRIPFAGSITLEAGLSRPPGDGPFPLAVLSHGNPRSAADLRRMHPFSDYRNLRTFLLDRGYALVIPMRRGFGSSDDVYEEGYGSCQHPDYAAAGLRAADDLDAALRYMRAQTFVDRTRIVLVGHSGGGFASIAAASRNPEGVVAVVNFAGGRGSPGPDTVCGADTLVAAMARFGTTTSIPSLWIYSENDHFFAPALAGRMFAAFAAGSPQAEFVAAPPSGADGHQLVHRTAFWPDVVDAFLKKAVPPRRGQKWYLLGLEDRVIGGPYDAFAQCAVSQLRAPNSRCEQRPSP